MRGQPLRRSRTAKCCRVRLVNGRWWAELAKGRLSERSLHNGQAGVSLTLAFATRGLVVTGERMLLAGRYALMALWALLGVPTILREGVKKAGESRLFFYYAATARGQPTYLFRLLAGILACTVSTTDL